MLRYVNPGLDQAREINGLQRKKEEKSNKQAVTF